MKAAVIVVLLLLLLIPLNMIRQLVREREGRANETAQEIISGAGGELDLIGPILILPYDLMEREYREDRWITVRNPGGAVFLVPDTESVSVRLETEYRSRGIYQVPVYAAQLSIEGSFPAVDADYFPDGAVILEDEFRLFTGIDDMRGIQAVSSVSLGNRTVEFEPDSGTASLGGGISVALDEFDMYADSTSFSWTMDVNGGGRISVTPLGRDSLLDIAGDWPSPSFGGAVLPRTRDLDDAGFTASWTIPEVSRPIGTHWSSAYDVQPDLRIHALEVKLMEPVGTYTRSLRSVKYGILFLLIPFVVFFLFEAFGRAKIHPVQYLLAGCADVLFYLLLLAVSEHLGFDPAYLIAALSATILLSLYSVQIVGRTGGAAIMPVVLGAAYLWLWVTLQSEDYALLIGAIGLFALVALVMLVTRKVNWYAARGSGDDDELGTEGQEGQSGQFEMLSPEGNPDNGDSEKEARKDMPHGQLPAEKQDPDDVPDSSTGPEVSDYYFPAEGPEDK